MIKTAEISPDGKHRFELRRVGAPQLGFSPRTIVFIGLNPSTADAERDDPTIRRCLGFAGSFRCSSLLMLNLFTIRATKPADMRRVPPAERNGKNADRFFDSEHIPPHFTVVCAWGAIETAEEIARAREVTGLLGGRNLWMLGLTAEGWPRHPLFVRKDAVLCPWASPLATSPA